MTEQTQLLKAIQHPTRQEILHFLNDYPSEIPYSDLLHFCDESTGKLNYHLRILDDLITKSDQGYNLSERGKQVVGWIQQLDQSSILKGSPEQPDIIISRIFPSDRLVSKYTIQAIILSLFFILPTLVFSFWLDFLWYILLGELVVLALTIGFIWLYVSSIWYRLTETEVEVHKGIITKTHKIVPYRTMTNVDHKQGPFDRLYSMGTVDIHTAGKSSTSTGPAEKLVGMIEAHEIRETLLERIRLLNPPNFLMATTERKTRTTSPGLLSIRNELVGLNQELESKENAE